MAAWKFFLNLEATHLNCSCAVSLCLILEIRYVCPCDKYLINISGLKMLRDITKLPRNWLYRS